MNENFLPLRRELQRHWTYTDSQYLHLWLEILFNARFAFEPKTDVYKGVLYTIKRGEFLFSRPSYSQRLNIPESRIRKCIDLMQKEKMIEIVRSLGKNKPTIYKVIKYESYNLQPTEIADNQKKDKKFNDLQPSETVETQGEGDYLAKWRPSGDQVATKSQPLKKKEKKDKKEKNVLKYSVEFETFYSIYPDPFNKEQTFKNWKTCLKTDTVENIMLATRNYLQYLKDNNTQKLYYTRSTNFLGQKQEYKGYLDYKGGQYGQNPGNSGAGSSRPKKYEGHYRRIE